MQTFNVVTGMELLAAATLLCFAFKVVVGLVTGGLGGPVMFCPECAFVGQGKTVVRGTLQLEMLLWWLFIIPGLAYSVWRISNQQRVCACCYHAGLLPHDAD